MLKREVKLVDPGSLDLWWLSSRGSIVSSLS